MSERRAEPVRAPTHVVSLPDEAATIALGAKIASQLATGDLVTLRGPIGAGKTTLARAILRARLGQPELEAPSPTFTLVQSYDGSDGQVVHADLYRVAVEGELLELGFEEWQDNAAVLVEWPERAPTLLDRPRLDVSLEPVPGSGGREAVLSGHGPLVERLERGRALEAVLEAAGWAQADRAPMCGDASSRIYQRLTKPAGETAILMISPPRPDGPPVRRGRPYSAIARLAESVHSFAAIDRALLDQGFSAPRILGEDLEAGLLLLEDLGSEPIVDAGGPIADRYADAVRCLAVLHGRSLPATLPLGPDRTYAIPPYDLDAMLIETELLLDWYVPHVSGTQPSGSVRAEFGHVWRALLADILAGPQTWTLRDYHSPNLIWLRNRHGLARVGMLDFQDAVLGPPAYDVASLLQDARVTVPPELELRLLGVYAAARKAADPGFDMAGFASAYVVMAAQRATKILGIFARLDRRDGKPQYLAHIPRILTYLRRNLSHPGLARLRAWYEAQLPAAFGPQPEPETASDDAQDGAEPPAAADAPGIAVSDRDGSGPTPGPENPHANPDAFPSPVRGVAEAGSLDGSGSDAASTPGGPPGEGERENAMPPPECLYDEDGRGSGPATAAATGARPAIRSAMVLAAGHGTRMRPITDTCPKPLVPVGGRALIDHAFARLREAGIAEAVVNVHHLADQLEAHVGHVHDLPIRISDERDELLETGGGVKRALPLLGPDFLVMNSDSLWIERGAGNLRRLLAAWNPDEMDALLLLARRESLGYDGRGDFDRLDDGRLSRRPPGAVASYVYAGVAILKSASFDDSPDGPFSLNLIFDRAVGADRLYGLVLEGEWLHVGTPDAIRAAEERLAAGSD